MSNEELDRYQILEKIGAGGMGTVYRALDREIERDVALKWLPAYFSADKNFTERFKREARVIARLEHPHIVPIYDVGENEGRPFIIMRLLSGGTLRERAARADYDLNALVKTIKEIADALSAAHVKHIIHRDIKPGNILFDDNGSAFLSDFGIAKVLDSGTQLTGSGFIGTPAYMSPEQFIAQDIDGRSDQYALAVVVYEVLTGELPFSGNTAQMMYKHINAEPPQIDLEKHPIPSDLNPVLAKALSKDPEDRFPHINDFATAMEIAVRRDPQAEAAVLPLAAGAIAATGKKLPTAPTDVDPPTEQQTEQLRQDYRQGLEAMSRGEWALALAAFTSVLEISPEYGNAQEFKQQAEANFKATSPPVPDSREEIAATVVHEPPSLPEETSEQEAEEIEETGFDLPIAAVGAAAAIGMTDAGEDLGKTSLDLPPGYQMDDEDLEKTSLDLPPMVPPGDGDIVSQPEMAATSLDIPPLETAVSPAAASMAAAETNLDLPPITPTPTAAAASPSAAPVAAPEKEKRSAPLWLVILGAILLFLLCAGGGYAAFNYFNSGTETAEGPTVVADPAVAVVGEQETATPEPEPTDTEEAELEPSDTPEPEPTDTEEAVVVDPKDTEVPPTATDPPTETPEPLPFRVRIIPSSVNLRRGPGVRYQVLGYPLAGETAEVIARTRDGTWFNVLMENGTRGWLSADVVEAIDGDPVRDAPVAATIPAAPTATQRPPTIVPPTLPPPPTPGDEGGGNSGGNDDDGNDNPDPPPVYTAEAP